MAGVPVLFITANVGSIFEEPSVMLKIWTEEFLSTVSKLDPKFIALHCQEVGGKNYEQSMRHVEDFVRLLMSSEELRLFDKIRVFLDEDYSSAEHFTALGNFYFVHESLTNVLLWDFNECAFVTVNGKDVHSGNIEAVTTKEKAKFPQQFFPECRWSRKGFLRTRWSISGTIFDLTNIHLFHDASNFIAMETFPSVYSKTRRRALEHTLDRFHNDKHPNVPYFLFGDFNFRTDTEGVIKKLTENTQEKRLSNKGSISKLQFHNPNEDLILTLGKKEFSHHEHQNIFVKNGGEWLREYDKELGEFEGRLFEFPISFVPSYPFQEDINEPVNYMQTRVPAWCDRVLLSPSAKTLVQKIDDPDAVKYDIMGPTTCMGDHKPIYWKASLTFDAGMIDCCNLPFAPEFCFRVPNNYLELLYMLPDSNSYANARADSVDRSSNLLHAIPVKHDPYTPDSMDSPSPNALTNSGEVPDLDHINNGNGNNGDNVSSVSRSMQTSSTSRRHVDRAVSPALLKSRLELIVQNKRRNENAENADASDMKRSPSECHLRSCSDNEDRQWCVRKNRCNSDVSWQRSHVLTQAWIHGKGQQGYHSFSNFANRSSSNSSADMVDGLPPDLIIPRIAIINASNFESNESSVYFHDDRLSNYSENKLSAYSDGRTKTLSGEAVSSDKSDELICDKDDENDHLSRSVDGRMADIKENNVYARDHAEPLPSEELYFDKNAKNDFIDDQCDMCKETKPNFQMVEVQAFMTDASCDDNVAGRTCNKLTTEHDVPDKTRFKGDNYHSTKITVLLEIQPSSQPLRRISDKPDVHPDGANVTAVDTRCERLDAQMPVGDRDCGSGSMTTCPDIDVDHAVSHDAEITSCDDKRKVCTSRNEVTRSNSSTHSQDNSDHAGNAKLTLTAYRVTERCKSDIIGRRTRCRKCCCVVS